MAEARLVWPGGLHFLVGAFFKRVEESAREAGKISEK